MLEYEHVDEMAVQRKQRRRQFAAGMAAPYALALPVIVVANALQDLPAGLVTMYAIVLIATVVNVHLWTSWKNFLPGVLTGFLVGPLVFAFSCAIVMGAYETGVLR